MSIFGTIQAKPIYRDARGHFRKETPEEFRARHDDRAWAHHVQQEFFAKKICTVIASSNPYAELLSNT